MHRFMFVVFYILYFIYFGLDGFHNTKENQFMVLSIKIFIRLFECFFSVVSRLFVFRWD